MTGIDITVWIVLVLLIAIILAVVRSATFVLPIDVPFADAKRADLTVREGVPHTSI